jgi:hypothetical protein
MPPAVEVRRALSGPGLRPGPRRQARRAVAAGDAKQPGGRRGGPAQCAAFRPADCDIFTASGALGASASAWPWCRRARQRDTAGTAGGRSPGPRCAAAGYGGDRRRPVTGAAVRGSSPRRRARVRRTRRKLPPRNGETRVNPAAYGGSLWPLIPSRLLAPVLAVHGWGRQARRAEGAPLKP